METGKIFETLQLSVRIENFKEKYQFMKKPICRLTLIYAIAIIAIIRADYNHIDDLGRVLHGYKGWDAMSRYVSFFSSAVLHADNYLTDISPLPQLLAVFLLALSSVIVIYALSGRQKITFWEIIAVLPLGISPFGLDCLVYKYDSPYMALSILASVFPFLFLGCKTLSYSICSIAGILVMCTTYQASSGIYPMLTAFICFKWWNSGKSVREVFKFLASSFASYAAALGIYSFFIMKPVDSYVSSSFAPIGQIVQQLRTYFTIVYYDFKTWWSALVCLLAISFIYLAVRDSSRKKYGSLFMAILTVFICIIMSFGVYPALSKPLYSPRAMYGFGALIAFLGVSIAGAGKLYPAKAACLGLSYAFFVFAFTLGNAIAEQSRYTDFRVELVLHDLNDLEIFSTDEVKKVQLSGNIGQSPVIRNMPQNYKMLNQLVRNYFGGSDYWKKYYFYNYFDLKNVAQDNSIDLTTYSLPILKDTMYHTISGNDEYILIELK